MGCCCRESGGAEFAQRLWHQSPRKKALFRVRCLPRDMRLDISSARGFSRKLLWGLGRQHEITLLVYHCVHWNAWVSAAWAGRAMV